MRLEYYIGDLLYRYECVTLPGFGSFLTQFQSARIHESVNAFYPPSKSISFNSQVTTNDGLFTSYVAQAEKIPYEDASKEIQLAIADWKKILEAGETLSLKRIGELWLNEENTVQFQPYTNINYLTGSFGLSSFIVPPVIREEHKKVVESIEQKAPIAFTPEKRLHQRPYLKYAAIALMAISLGAVIYKIADDQLEVSYKAVQKEANQQVNSSIQEATFFDTDPLELPTITLNVVKKTLRYHVVAGAFRSEENADVKVTELILKGYPADKVGKNKYGLHQVAFSSFATYKEALVYLANIQKNESPEAWLLVTD
mgnify:CR=1 FL=1